MSTGHSELQTVKFRGADGLTLIADEWNRDGDIGAGPAVRPVSCTAAGRTGTPGRTPARSWPMRVCTWSRSTPAATATATAAPDANYSVDALCTDTIAVHRPDRPADDPDRGQHGRDDGHPGRRRGRTGEGDEAGARRRGAAVREGRQRTHPRVHGQRLARLRVTRRGRRSRRLVSAAPDETAQPRRPEEEPAVARRALVLALGSGVPDRARSTTRSSGWRSSSRPPST